MALRQGKSIPLQEDIDPDYEPSAEGKDQPGPKAGRPYCVLKEQPQTVS